MKLSTTLSTMAVLTCLTFPAAVNAQPVPVTGGTVEGKSPRDALLAELSPEKAKLYQDTMDQMHAKNKSFHENLDKLQQDMSNIMTAETFDKKAYFAKNKEIDKLYAVMRSNTAESIAAMAEKSTAAERSIYEKLHQLMKHSMEKSGYHPHTDK